MTALLIILLMSLVCLFYISYTEHIRERDLFFAKHKTNWLNRSMWQQAAIIKVLICLAMLGGVLRLYYMLG